MTVFLGIVIMMAFFFDMLRKRLQRIEHRIAEILLKIGPATRCPTCGHPVIVGAFHDGDPYTCLECGETYLWKLDEGVYVLVTIPDGHENVGAYKPEWKRGEGAPTEDESGFGGPIRGG